MVMYVGETVTIIGSATDPLRLDVNVADAVAVADFYEPGTDPKGNPDDRTPDKPQIALTWDATVSYKFGAALITGAYIGYVDTTGWTPGKWSFKVTLSGSVDSWEYGTFTLKA